MQNTIAQELAGIVNTRDREAVRRIVGAVADRLSCQVFSSAGLVIKAGASALVKAGSAFYGMASNVLVNKAANTDMAALSGTVTNAKFNVFCFYIDSSGTLTTVMGVEGAALANVKFPDTPQGKAMIGFVIINPTGTGNFVGGTTALDDATVVPNAAYVNTIGAFDPTVRLG